MDDYISRKAAREAFENADADVCESYPDGACDWGFGMKNIQEVIDEIPAADVEPVRRGRWVGRSGLFQGECSVCGYRTYDKTADWARKYWTYRPNCGTKMYSEGTNDD